MRNSVYPINKPKRTLRNNVQPPRADKGTHYVGDTAGPYIMHEGILLKRKGVPRRLATHAKHAPVYA